MGCDLAALISAVCGIKSIVQGRQDIGHKASIANSQLAVDTLSSV